jgi:hypothetical protein
VRYYLIEEDWYSEHKVYLGEIALTYREKMAMAIGDYSQIPRNPLRISLKYRPSRMSDYLSLKFTFVSQKLKKLICAQAAADIFFRPSIFLFNGEEHPFYLIVPAKYDCIDFERSFCRDDEGAPGGIRVDRGFSVCPHRVAGADIFRVKGLSNRKLVISEKFKKVMEKNDICGVKFTLTENYQDD